MDGHDATSRSGSRRALAATDMYHFAVLRDGAVDRLDELPERRPRAPPARDREHLEQPVRLGHGREHRGEVPAPPPRVRGARLHRVEFKTDAKNERARAALAAIPAEFEGIHRKHMVVRGGERRDSAWYAVIDDDWPEVKAGARAEDRRDSARLRAARYPLRNWSSEMNSVNVIGRGRVGSARRRSPARSGASSCATTAPSSSSSACPTARSPRSPPRSSPGPGSRTSSGATPLAALDPHRARFSVHPLQTFTLERGPEQLDGAWAAVTAENDEARALGRELADTLGLRPFDLDDARPHALPRGRGDRVELPRHALPRRLRASSRTRARRPRRSSR